MRKILITIAATGALTLAGCVSPPHTGPTTVYAPSGMPSGAASPSIPGLPPVVVPPAPPAAGPFHHLACAHPVQNALRNWECHQKGTPP